MPEERLRWRMDNAVQQGFLGAWQSLRAITRRVGLRRRERSTLWCSALWERSAILSDGTVVCSCRDEAKRIVLGNALEQPFEQIWNGTAYRAARDRILEGKALDPLCLKCPFLSHRRPSQAGSWVSALPTWLYLEASVRCNLACISCPRPAIVGSRTRQAMTLAEVARVADPLGPHLEHIHFYAYGEPFMQPEAPAMLRHLRAVSPRAELVTNTNGHYLDTATRREAVLCSGLDGLVFSIDGGSPQTYAIYRRQGDFERVVNNLRELVQQRRSLGLTRPRIEWQYLLFNWNDSDAELERARQIAGEAGVDRLFFRPARTPLSGISWRYLPFTGRYKRIGAELG